MKSMVLQHEVTTRAIHGVTGDLVGTSDTQTLTNKTLTSATLTTPTISGASVTHKNASYSSDGAITIASSSVAFLTKAGVGAYTMAAPSSQDGTVMQLVSTTANAHVVTFTGGTLWDGTAGVNTTATFAAVQGASITVIAKGAEWFVLALNAVTPAP